MHRRSRGRNRRVSLFGSAAATAALAVPVRKFLAARGIYDVPNHRSSHDAPTPRSGGIAALIGATTAAVMTGARPTKAQTVSIVALAGLGLWDDLTGHAPAPLRLAGQLGIGATLLGHGTWDRAVSALTTAGVVNAVNFMDGIDGISGMTAVVWGINAMHLDDRQRGPEGLAVLGALTAGAGLGFLPHNVPHARLFPGDVGSYALGAAFAGGILSQRGLAARYRAAAPLLLYGVDSLLAIVARMRRGERLDEAHRDHVYQRLVDGGRTHAEVATLHAGIACAIAAASRLPLPWASSLTVASVVFYLASPTVLSRGEDPEAHEGRMAE